MLIFQQKEIHRRRLLRYAREDAKEWKQLDSKIEEIHTIRRQSHQLPECLHWKRPMIGWVKCNTDGAYNPLLNQSSAGWVIRDANGSYKGSAQARGRVNNDALESELQAILMALQHCWSLGYKKVIIESDREKAIDIINKKRLHFAYYNWRREIQWWAAKFQDVKFQWTRRSANKVADLLAKQIENGVAFSFHYYVPQYLSVLLHNDHLHSS